VSTPCKADSSGRRSGRSTKYEPQFVAPRDERVAEASIHPSRIGKYSATSEEQPARVDGFGVIGRPA
jgi:hypothetical protein